MNKKERIEYQIILIRKNLIEWIQERKRRRKNPFDIQEYMTHGVERVVSGVIKATLKIPKESALWQNLPLPAAARQKKRRIAEDQCEHIPPFLIASITSKCNLHYAGCPAAIMRRSMPNR